VGRGPVRVGRGAGDGGCACHSAGVAFEEAEGGILEPPTDMALFQVQLSIKLDGPGNGETRRRQGDIVDEDCSKVNDESMRWSRGMSAVDKKQGTGNKPDPQLPMRSRMCETSHDGLQTASPVSQNKPSVKLNGPRDGEMRRRYGDVVYDRCWTTNDGSREKLTNSSVWLQEWSTDMYSLARRPKALDKHVWRVDDRPPRVNEDSRGDHNGTGTMRHSYTNVVPGGDDNEVSCLSKEMVNERWTARCTPSIMNKRRGVPAAQRPTHSKTRNKYSSGLQMTEKSHQKQLLDGSRIQRREEPCNSSHIRRIEGSSGGSSTQHDRGIVDERRSNPNVKHKEILTKLSVGLQERSTMLYSLAREPKAPDKCVWHRDNRQGAKAHNAPQPTEGNCGKQFLNQQDAFGRQQSLCDSRHTSHDTTRECVAERGEMERAHPTYPKLYTPPPFLVDSWSIPSIPVHSQKSLGSPGSFPPHSQFIPGPFPEQGGVGMGGEKGGGESI
jgi:hypothetical protein